MLYFDLEYPGNEGFSNTLSTSTARCQERQNTHENCYGIIGLNAFHFHSNDHLPWSDIHQNVKNKMQGTSNNPVVIFENHPSGCR